MYSGHYPYRYCHITNVQLHGHDGRFYIHGSEADIAPCAAVTNIWDIVGMERYNGTLPEYTECTELHNIGHTFTIYYHGGSNYYHLHYDMLLPLYLEVYHNTPEEDKREHVFMPTVESSRMKPLNWDTSAFDDGTKYWNKILEFITGPHTFLPLNRDIRQEDRVICFNQLYFGTPKFDFKDSAVVKGYVNFVKRSLNIDVDSWKKLPQRKVAIISRSNRRLILNEQELVEGLGEIENIDADLVKFEGKTFEEQVAMMSDYTVVAGINGAGLMNAIYMPPHGVTIQMVPYMAQVNHVQYGNLLAARGPYMVWHNTHEDMSEVRPTDRFNSSANTRVHVPEFRDVVKQALDLAEQHQKSLHDEL